MRRVAVEELPDVYQVRVLSDNPIPGETWRGIPRASRITQVASGTESPSEYWHLFQLARVAAGLTAAELATDYQAFFDADELILSTHNVDTQHFPNTATLTVAKLIDLARQENPHARARLQELSELWQREHRDAVKDLESLRSVCPEDRVHFRRQQARVARRGKLIAWIEAFLGGHEARADQIAMSYHLA